MKNERHHSYLFTINNYSLSDWFGVKNLFTKATYGVCGEEVAPTTGTPHLQGYIHLKDAVKFDAVQKYLTRASIRVATGGDLANQTYCSKGENIYEVGTPSEGQGKRNDIKEVAQKIKNKEITLEDCMFDYPDLYMKYSRSLEKMFDAVMEKRREAPLVFWRWGLAGTGKTRFCIDSHESHYVKDGTPWWDGYKQQDAIIIDDFDNSIPFRTLLRILDRYVYQGQVKGSYIQVNSKYIYITCEYPPQHYWRGNELEQVLRRITSVDEIK